MRNFMRLLIFALCLSSCGQNQGIAFLGNLDSNTIHDQGVDYTFTSSKMTSSDLYKIADQDAIGKTNDSLAKFSKVIKKSQKVVVRVGWWDVYPLLKINPQLNLFEYDDELLERQLAILNYNLYHLFDEIIALRRNVKIFSVGCSNFYDFAEPEELLFNTVLQALNAAIIDAGLDYNVTYIDVSNLKSDQNVHLKIMEFVI